MKKFAILPVAMAAVTMSTCMVPAHADSRQKNKNMWRNLAIGAGVIAGHGLITHNSTETLLGAAGAAYSANRYEQDRRSQSRESAARARYHRTHRYHHVSSNRRYYTYHGHRYYMNLSTGRRVRLD